MIQVARGDRKVGEQNESLDLRYRRTVASQSWKAEFLKSAQLRGPSFLVLGAHVEWRILVAFILG